MRARESGSAGRPATSSGGVSVRAFDGGDESRVLELLRDAFGSWPSDIASADPAEYFRWKHLHSPLGPSLMVVAEADGAAVGFAAWMRWRLLFDGTPLEALRSVDMVVDPRHRGRGVPVSMIRAASERFPSDVVVSFSNPNERARPGALKSGRFDVGTLRRYYRPVVAGRLRRGANGVSSQTRSRTAATVLEDPGVVSMLADAPPPATRIATRKSPEYLRWRYGGFGGCRAVDAAEDGVTAGIAIFRVQRHGRAAVARVCELIVRGPGVERRLLRAVGRAAEAGLLTCAFRSGREAVRHGFLPAAGGPRLVVRPRRDDLHPDPLRLESWEMSVGDREL